MKKKKLALTQNVLEIYKISKLVYQWEKETRRTMRIRTEDQKYRNRKMM